MLEPYRESGINPRPRLPTPEVEDGIESFFVKHISKVRYNFKRKRLEWYVIWEGLSEEQGSWQPLEDLVVDEQPIFALENFRKTHPNAEEITRNPMKRTAGPDSGIIRRKRARR